MGKSLPSGISRGKILGGCRVLTSWRGKSLQRRSTPLSSIRLIVLVAQAFLVSVMRRMLWTMHRGRAVGAVREDGGICFVQGTVDGSEHQTVHVADEKLAGLPAEVVCLETVLDAAIAGLSAVMLLKCAGTESTRYVMVELFDASHRLQPTIVLSFTVSEASQEENEEERAFLRTKSRTSALQPWILDGPMICIPRTKSVVVAHLSMNSRRGEVTVPPSHLRFFLWLRLTSCSDFCRFHLVGTCTRCRHQHTARILSRPSAPFVFILTSPRLWSFFAIPTHPNARQTKGGRGRFRPHL